MSGQGEGDAAPVEGLDALTDGARAALPPLPNVAGWGQWINEWGWFQSAAPPRPMLLAKRGGVRRLPGAESVVGDADGVLPLGKLGMIAAPGGTGKSALATHLALCVATGRPFLGWEVVKPGAVVMALAEEDAGEMHRRIRAAADGLDLSDDDRVLASRRIFALPLAGKAKRLVADPKDPEANMTGEALLTLLREKAPRDGGWSLVVLDPMSRFGSPMMETDNAAATDAVAFAERFCDLPGTPTVLMMHHTPKGQGVSSGSGNKLTMDSARGASALRDGARWMAVLDRVVAEGTEPHHPAFDDPGWEVELRVVKSNYTQTGISTSFRLKYGVVVSTQQQGRGGGRDDDL
jgi:hypothetical protein